jgi:hypothetical protein
MYLPGLSDLIIYGIAECHLRWAVPGDVLVSVALSSSNLEQMKDRIEKEKVVSRL